MFSLLSDRHHIVVFIVIGWCGTRYFLVGALRWGYVVAIREQPMGGWGVFPSKPSCKRDGKMGPHVQCSTLQAKRRRRRPTL